MEEGGKGREDYKARIGKERKGGKRGRRVSVGGGKEKKRHEEKESGGKGKGKGQGKRRINREDGTRGRRGRDNEKE